MMRAGIALILLTFGTAVVGRYGLGHPRNWQIAAVVRASGYLRAPLGRFAGRSVDMGNVKQIGSAGAR